MLPTRGVVARGRFGSTGLSAPQQEIKPMSIRRLFRSSPRPAARGENAEVSRILKRGPFDRPTGLRETHSFNRSLDGRW